ncbi:hypothetical protein OK016_28085 [Vibrio chagasii]|nr:hypothetical protein [Vibrio chagasii]
MNDKVTHHRLAILSNLKRLSGQHWKALQAILSLEAFINKNIKEVLFE